MDTPKIAAAALIGFKSCVADGTDVVVDFRQLFSEAQSMMLADVLTWSARLADGRPCVKYSVSEEEKLTTIRIKVGDNAEKIARAITQGHEHCIRPKGKGRRRQAFFLQMDGQPS